MIYKNGEMKVDQLVGYFNSNKISLIPPFQRGTVWTLKMRQKLIENMLNRRPIPAIFLYKDPEGPDGGGGATFTYNILDGKQRLETLLLFIGDQSKALSVKNLKDYFFNRPLRPVNGRAKPVKTDRTKNFPVELNGHTYTFDKLDKDLLRPFADYAIPVIEIEMDEDRAASLDELTQLFVDINTYGKKVTRFDVIKAVNEDPLIKDVYNLIAIKEMRGKTPHSKLKDTPYTKVLKQLNAVSRLTDTGARVDLVWERLVEIALYARTKQHRAPAQVLGAFFKREAKKQFNSALSKEEKKNLRDVFGFMASAYASSPELQRSKLATDQPQFYTLITTLLTTDLSRKFAPDELARRLTALGNLIDREPSRHPLKGDLEKYRETAIRTTADTGRRLLRQQLLIKMLNAV